MEPTQAELTAIEIWRRHNKLGNRVCFGIDPAKIEDIPPEALVMRPDGTGVWIEETLLKFCLELARAVAPFVGSFKPNISFWEQFGEEGLRALRRLVVTLRCEFPDHLIIIDAKRNDIGPTADKAAQGIFDYGCSAVTVNPYLGYDCVNEFTKHQDKMTVVLVRTSNKSAAPMQDIRCIVTNDWIDEACRVSEVDPVIFSDEDRRAILGECPYYIWVAWQLKNLWNKLGNCAAVVGATAPEQMAEIVTVLGDMPVLSPGFGTQGASPAAIIPAAVAEDGSLNVIANSSSVIMLAYLKKYKGMSYTEAAAAAANELHDEITQAYNASKRQHLLVLRKSLDDLHAFKRGMDPRSINPANFYDRRIPQDELIHLFREMGAFWQYHGDPRPDTLHALTKAQEHTGLFVLCLEVLQHSNLCELLARQMILCLPEEYQEPCGLVTMTVTAAESGIDLMHEVARQLGAKHAFVGKDAEGELTSWRYTAEAEDQVLLGNELLTTPAGSAYETKFTVMSKNAIQPVNFLPFCNIFFNRSSHTALEDGTPILGPIHLPMPNYKPDDCPFCQAGGTVVKPKLGDHWTRMHAQNAGIPANM